MTRLQDLDCKEIDLQDKFYGLFQCFMPDGVGVEAMFALLQNDSELRSHGVADARGVWSGRGARVFLPAVGSEI